MTRNRAPIYPVRRRSVSTLCAGRLKDGPLMRIFAEGLTAGFSAQRYLFFDGRTVIQNSW